MAQLPLNTGIPRFKQNEERMDRFTNGSDNQTFTTSGGVEVPTIRKFLKDKDGEIDSNVEQMFEEAATGLVASVTAEADRSRDEADRSETARDIAAGYASDALTGGMDPGITTIAGLPGITIPEGVSHFRASGYYAAEDGGGAFLTDINNGTEPLALSGGGTARPWYVASNEVDPRMFGASPFADPLVNTEAFQKAVRAAKGRPIPVTGEYVITAPVATRVGVDEGTAIFLDEDCHNALFVARGRAVLKPASNKIEMFVQDGADNVRFEGIVFDNSANGPLQGQAKQTVATPNVGVAGQGNAANCAIRQYRGAGLAIPGCRFIDFISAVDYIGDADDNNALSGHLEAIGARFKGCAFPLLVDSPETVTVRDCVDEDGIDSDNLSGEDDPGHLLYVSDRPGAAPKAIAVSGNKSFGRPSSPIKVRKGQTLSITGNVLIGNGRGIEVWNVEGGVVTGNDVQLAPIGLGNDSAIELTDCGNVLTEGNTLDVSGCDAWAIRVRRDLNNAPYQNKGNVIGRNLVADDVSASAGKAVIAVVDQVKPVIDEPIFNHTGTTEKGARMIDISGGSGAVVRYPQYRTRNAVSNSDRILRFRGSHSGGRVSLREADIDGGLTYNSVQIEAGSSAIVLNGIGFVAEPTIAPSTVGDWAPTYSARYLRWRREGRMVHWWLRLTFSTNAYTTASGSLIIRGLPFVAGGGSSEISLWAGSLAEFRNISFGASEQVGIYVPQGTDTIELRRSSSAGAGQAVQATHIGPSISNVQIVASGGYEVA